MPLRSTPRSRWWRGRWWVGAAMALAACGDDRAGEGGGGAAASSSATSTSTATGSTAVVATGGGAGGEGGAVSCAEGCSVELPVCEDGACVAACTDGAAACDTPDVATCCASGAQCCAGTTPGSSGCREVCETTCPDGVTVCGFGTLCEQRPADESWSCTPEPACQLERRCGDTCCPVGSRCEEGACPLPNLQIDEERLASSVEVFRRTFSVNACEIPEGCVDAPGSRRLLRFDLKTPNVGEGDLFLGMACADPADPNPSCADPSLFQFENCHGHPHFTSYAAYRLLDGRGGVVATGHKQAFCLLDFERQDGPPSPIYHCGFQGIQAGWADVYNAELPCQWVDVTDVAPGDYRLEITLNHERVLVESDYDDDVAMIDVSIRADSCPGGCGGYDPEVCQPGDPEGRAGDGTCDCYGIQEWDAADCSACDACARSSCPGGCEVDLPDCCGDEDTCDLAGNGVCNCGGAAPWDTADCQRCVSADLDCPPFDSCPSGCGPTAPECPGGVVEAWQGDGFCDCGAPPWDTLDCFSCGEGCGP